MTTIRNDKGIMSRTLGEWLMGRRDNDLRVVVHGIGVPIGLGYYDPEADMLMLELADGTDLRDAYADCPQAEESDDPER